MENNPNNNPMNKKIKNTLETKVASSNVDHEKTLNLQLNDHQLVQGIEF